MVQRRVHLNTQDVDEKKALEVSPNLEKILGKILENILYKLFSKILNKVLDKKIEKILGKMKNTT